MRRGTERPTIFVVHHRADNGRYSYDTDPNDAIASAQALLRSGEQSWVAGNCHRLIQDGDLLLFKFGSSRLRQEPGIYAAARVTRAPVQDAAGTWWLRYKVDPQLTRRLLQEPLTGRNLARVVDRSFGASIQAVSRERYPVLGRLLGGLGHAGAGASDLITRGLPIHKKWLDKILAGTKTWEIRGKATAMRGSIALIQSKSGTVVGTCELVEVVGPLTLAQLRRNADRTGFHTNPLIEYENIYAWVLENAKRLPTPVPYRHPNGAVIWVKLEPVVTRRLEALRARP